MHVYEVETPSSVHTPNIMCMLRKKLLKMQMFQHLPYNASFHHCRHSTSTRKISGQHYRAFDHRMGINVSIELILGNAFADAMHILHANMHTWSCLLSLGFQLNSLSRKSC